MYYILANALHACIQHLAVLHVFMRECRFPEENCISCVTPPEPPPGFQPAASQRDC